VWLLVSFWIQQKNIFEYVETIFRTLKTGGIWINIGPLLYHWVDMPGELSVELSYDELRIVIKEMGFEFLEESIKQTTYSSNSKSLLQNVYRCCFFVVKKK